MIDNSGSLVQSSTDTLRLNCSCLATDSLIEAIRIARATGFSASISLTASTVNPVSCHLSISSCMRDFNLSTGIPEFLFLCLEFAIRLSNSDNDKEEVERSSTSPLLSKPIHSPSSIERCLAPLLALISINDLISSSSAESSSNSRNIATLRITSSSPSIDASRVIKASMMAAASL